MKRSIAFLSLVLLASVALADGLAKAIPGEVRDAYVDASKEPLNTVDFPKGKEKRGYMLDQDHPEKNKAITVIVGKPEEKFGQLENGRLVVAVNGSTALVFDRYIQEGKSYSLKAVAELKPSMLIKQAEKKPTLFLGDGYRVHIVLQEPAGLSK